MTLSITQKKEPVFRNQRHREQEQRGAVVKGMADPAIGAVDDQGEGLAGDDGIG